MGRRVSLTLNPQTGEVLSRQELPSVEPPASAVPPPPGTGGVVSRRRVSVTVNPLTGEVLNTEDLSHLRV